MKLRYSTTSPFVRKVSVVALETGQDAAIERVATDLQDPKSDLAQDNPLGKLPALILDDGTVLYDSPVICEYLDGRHDGARLFPAEGPARWRALRQQALADGLLDAAILVMVEERRRPEALRWAGWRERQLGKVSHSLDALEAQAGELEGALTIGTITVGIALEYLDFRFPDLGWRESRPRLAKWQAAFSERSSMQATWPREAT